MNRLQPSTGNLAMILAPKAIARCPRCYNPIVIGAAIEVLGVDTKGVRTWAHAGCKDPVAMARAERKEETNGTSVPLVKPVVASNGQSVTLRDALDNAMPVIVRKVKAEVFPELNAEIGTFVTEGRATLETILGKIDAKMDAAADAIRLSLLEVARQCQKVIVEVKIGNVTKTNEQGEVFNEVFPEVMDLICAGENVFLPGPTGCGKTHLAEQLARYIPNEDGTFGRPFGMIAGSGGVTETEIKGTSIPNITTGENVFVSTRFLDIYEHGGVFLIDEADAMDSNVLLAINSAISNGYLAVPKRTEKPLANRHKDFLCVFAANTYGNGADRVYVGRNKLDGATMDRFVSVPVDYDETVEKSLCPNPDLYAMLMTWRKRIMESRLTRVLSSRFVAFAARWQSKGVEYLARKLTKDRGWTVDEMRKVIGNELTDAIK